MKKLYNLEKIALLRSFFKRKMFLAGLITVLGTPAVIAQTAYCVPAPTSVDGMGITNVTIGSINNTSETEPDNYGNYTAQIVSIPQTIVQPFSVTFNTVGYSYNLKIWVDWNNDFDFDDAGEEVYTAASAAENESTVTGNLTVPAIAGLGNHRMRVGGVADNQATPCYEFSYGTFEDYTINVTDAPSCVAPSNAIGTVVASGSANLRWTAPENQQPVGYEYILNTSIEAPTTAGTPTTATTINSAIQNGVFYYLHVRSNCGGGDYSQWITSTVFVYVLGDTCSSAINLQTLSSPHTSTTAGANDDFSTECTDNTAPDVFYFIEVPLGYVLDIQQTDSNYDSLFTIFYGNCEDPNIITCNGFGNSGIVWENTTGSTQTIRWVQYGYYGNTGSFTLQWTLTPPPACNIPRTVAGQMISLTTANISWTLPVTGTPTGYEYAVTQSETPPAAGTATTNLSVTGVTTIGNTYNYLHVRANCGTDGYSEWVTYAFYSGHCVPETSFFNFYYITSFATTNGDGSNISNTTAQQIAYTNNFNTMSVSQAPGRNFNYALGVDDYTDASIWVDWNNDLDFTDAGELVATHVYEGVNEGYTGTISVPPTTPPGNYRMRVRSRNAPFGNPCDAYEYGVAQDYAIAVGNPATCFNPVNVTGTGIASGTANLSWSAQNFGNTPTGYDYAVTTSLTPPDSGTSTTNTSVNNYSGLTDGTYYYLHVRTNCGNGDYSQWVTSRKFRYLQGDTCGTAINLTPLTSPYTSTTEGAANDYTPSCVSPTWAPDLFYYIEVPNGSTLVVQQSDANGYSSNYSIFYGNCISQIPIECLQSGGFPVYWENTTGSMQNVYWVQDGGRISSGEFTISWEFIAPAACDKPLNLDVTVVSTTSAAVSWGLPNTGTPAGYEYAVTQSATPPASGTYTATRTATVNGIVANADNYLHVRSICGEDGNSIWVTEAFYSGYCVPQNTEELYYITSVNTLGAETNFTTANNSFSAYTNYSAQYSVTSYPGGLFTMQATAPVATDEYMYSVWADWNNNFQFEESERIGNTQYIPSTADIMVSIPLQIPAGWYRLRLRNLKTGSPVNACNEAPGEAEDYTIIIGPAPTCFPPYGLSILPVDATSTDLSWSAPILGNAPQGYEYVLSSSSALPAGSGTATTATYIFGEVYNPAVNNYLYVRSACGDGDFSTWETFAVLDTTTPEFLKNNVMVYKDGGSINIASGNTVITGIIIYDIRGSKLYAQTDVNSTDTTITGLQIQQQVVIVEVTTAQGKVSKRIVF